ncbi:hypothetical protein [Streptomyces sp. 891-h]|uniref:hypothetical protein n=1 Tax=unclassified Streptomyces TaxID=2593676 RepID=UPI001FAB34ED|nr:hypothetical protein [Streptomyces sp. 891-h]
MQLNHAPSPDGAGTGAASDEPSLVVHQDDLGAVGHEAFKLHGMLRKKADIGNAGRDGKELSSTASAAKEMSSHHLLTGDELDTTLATWSSQVKTVLQMCAHISNHLDYSKKAHMHDDREIAASMRHRDGTPMSPSEILKHVK